MTRKMTGAMRGRTNHDDGENRLPYKTTKLVDSSR